MHTTDIEREVRGFLVDNFLFGRSDALQEDDSLLGGVIDSTGTIELVSFLQDRFGITVEDEDVVPENFDSLRHVVAYVSKKVQAKAASVSE